jgi:hypothetical protein
MSTRQGSGVSNQGPGISASIECEMTLIKSLTSRQGSGVRDQGPGISASIECEMTPLIKSLTSGPWPLTPGP